MEKFGNTIGIHIFFYSYVTWVLWNRKSAVTRLFVQQLLPNRLTKDYWPFVRGIDRSPVVSPYNGSVMPRPFLCHNVIIPLLWWLRCFFHKQPANSSNGHGCLNNVMGWMSYTVAWVLLYFMAMWWTSFWSNNSDNDQETVSVQRCRSSRGIPIITRTTRTPAFWDTPWLPTLVIHIRSQVKTRQSQGYKFLKNAKHWNFPRNFTRDTPSEVAQYDV